MVKHIGLVACIFLLSPVAHAASPRSPLEQISLDAMAARAKMMEQNASSADVDRFLTFCADKLVYEDPVVSVRTEGKNNIRDGMSSHLGETRNPHLHLINEIAAANVVVLEENLSFDYQQGAAWLHQIRRQVTIFEFDGEKIRRIADYWQR